MHKPVEPRPQPNSDTPPQPPSPVSPFETATAAPEANIAPNFNNLTSSYGSVTSQNLGLNMFGDQFARRGGLGVSNPGINSSSVLFTAFGAGQEYVIINPGGGGVVGRTKLSDDNSPLPRDRILFGYDYFQNVPLTPTGTHVARYSPGFEKTFFDGLTSLELRAPFASSIDNDLQIGQSSRQTQFGNMSLTGKALLLAGENGGIASGMQMGLPTANNTTLSLPGGQPFLRIVNQSITLAPYLAIYTTPTPRLFTQFWASTVFDTTGNRIDTSDSGGPPTASGRVFSQSMLSLDGQIGYRLYRNPQGFLQAFTPFGELHWNSTLGTPETVTTPDGFIFGYQDPHFNELNATFGANAIWSNGLLTSAGVSLPLRSGDDRTFDYQLGIRLSYFYGPQARQLSQFVTTY